MSRQLSRQSSPYLSLHFYVEQGDMAAVARQLAQGADVNGLSKYSERTPLICALERTSADAEADLEMVRLLIDQGADVNLAVADQWSGCFLGLPLMAAVQSRSLAKVRLLLEAGAQTRPSEGPSKSKFKYLLMDALIAYDDGFSDPVCVVGTDSLCSILRLLIEYGADLDVSYSAGAGSTQVCAVMRASAEGNFEVLRLLLEAGADATPLGWNALMWAIALEPIEKLEPLLAEEKNLDVALMETDHAQRTPWLLSLVVGDLAKAERLFLAEADYCAGAAYYGSMSVECVILGDSAAVLRWLVELGADVTTAGNSRGFTPLIQAAADGSVECLKLLIELGADIFEEVTYGGGAIKFARCREVMDVLCAAGESLSNIEDEMLPLVTGVRQLEMGLSREQFASGRGRRFGRAIPEEMDVGFWRAMVASGYGAYGVASKFIGDGAGSDGPTWCFRRFGRSLTTLPDGRVIAIAGEHEDYYDPDFCIYNDVVVYDGKGGFEIFGYPQEIFPPTDFHSATLVGDYIYIIGNLGYMGTRRDGETPVYRLNCGSLAMREIETTGENPGWICRHRARYDVRPDGVGEITISGGKISGMRAGKSDYYDNCETFCLNLSTLVWRKVED